MMKSCVFLCRLGGKDCSKSSHKANKAASPTLQDVLVFSWLQEMALCWLEVVIPDLAGGHWLFGVNAKEVV
jgi:hypothetical protein